MKRKAKDSEIHAYEFIKANLRLLGWDVRNPERADAGQVWTQNECLSNPEIKSCLGLNKPENIVKVTESVFWIIEAKRSHGQLEQAIKEAEEYAEQFEGSSKYEALFISGVAGNEIDSFLVRTKFFNGKRFVPVTLNRIDATGLLRQSELQTILKTNNPDIAEPEVDEHLFISRAEHINEILHLGAVNPHQRAGVMAALLLSMLSHTPPNIDERQPDVLINDINGRVQSILRDQGKSEFYDYIKIKLPSTIDNHLKLRRALVDTLQELNNLNIRSAMNSGADWLGAFYEVFLKYASWAQDLGIVLTPRHLTRRAADVIDVKVHDIIYDPTCGTGGFLVAAFDYVKQNSDPTQLTKFKQNSVFGIEQDAGVAALAVVNMIFRGDGKNNIHEGNCFSKYLDAHIEKGINTAKFTQKQSDNPPVTKVMMNPPFALKRSDEKEFRFINQALQQMEHGGLLFSVLPYSVMVKPGIYRTWRKESLLANHTLLSVVTFPIDVFYPVGITTVGVFIRKGIPHPHEQNVLWVRALTDGLLKSKGKRLPSNRTTNELADSSTIIKAFLTNPAYPVPNVKMHQKACPLDIDDPQLELVPEVYLDQAIPTHDDIAKGLEKSIRNAFAYLVKIDKAILKTERMERASGMVLSSPQWKYYRVSDIFELKRGHFHSISALDVGTYPTISRISTDNGFVGLYEKPETATVCPPRTITASTVTGDAFVQPIPFIATDNVVLLHPRPEFKNLMLTSLFFIAEMLNLTKWRYSYGRQCYKTKYAFTEVPLPTTPDGALDEQYMKIMVENTNYWPLVSVAFDKVTT